MGVAQQKVLGIFPSGPPANLRTYSTLHPTTGNLRPSISATTAQQQVCYLSWSVLNIKLSPYYTKYCSCQYSMYPSHYHCVITATGLEHFFSIPSFPIEVALSVIFFGPLLCFFSKSNNDYSF